MTDMIERVAHAIAHAVMEQSDNGVPEKASDWRNEARAALEAIREPSYAMLDAGTNVKGVDGYFFAGLDDAKRLYQAMINKALEESKL